MFSCFDSSNLSNHQETSMNRWDQKIFLIRVGVVKGVEDLGEGVFDSEEIEYESCEMCRTRKDQICSYYGT